MVHQSMGAALPLPKKFKISSHETSQVEIQADTW